MLKPKKTLILGSGALKIGQAGEFDYSGSQALKALKEENIQTILINPNIATIQTDHEMADQVYFLPVEPYFVEAVIKKEKVDSILLSFGGQTALNCGLTLAVNGVFEKYGVRVLGTPIKTIRDTEDRQLFTERLAEIKVSTATSHAVYTVADAIATAEKMGFPIMMRAGFALGGQGSAIVKNSDECRKAAEMGLFSAPQILIEECLQGWKEIEYEVMRDANDNCIAVCNMENFDPMGIHTGDSIVVAPAQTLDNFEYQLLRDVALKTIRHLGVLGECNIQFALDPASRRYRVIEVNARLSRSSALASKATGYPLAYVAAKIAIGYNLPDIENCITKITSAFFEPALDYIVCKFPRWDLDKFENVSQTIGSEMKSVGEVMAIGKTFPEALQKAIRMLDIGVDGLDVEKSQFSHLVALSIPTPWRIFSIANAIRQGESVAEIHRVTGIDAFYLHEIQRIITLEKQLQNVNDLHDLTYSMLLDLKRAGFADKKIGKLLSVTESDVRAWRTQLGVRPCLMQIDTLAAEYPAQTNILYFTYSSVKADYYASHKKKILILGSGCYRIGTSVEFDWCAVNAAATAHELGYETIMLNCNPETVSTDYDVCDNLVFDEISLECILELYHAMQPEGVIISMGGQIANSLALKLHQAGITILGTHPEAIDNTENRHKFSVLLDQLKIKQPLWAEASSVESINETVAKVGGFPVLVRPSYVLSGAAMRVANTAADLKLFLTNAKIVSREYPIVITKFEENAREIEFDAVAQQGRIIHFAITEHIENAGVHSGDSTLVIPAHNLSLAIVQEIQAIGSKLADFLKITGPFNIQLLATATELKIIECNLRAARSFPFVSKALGINFIREATRIMLGHAAIFSQQESARNYFLVKSPKFSFRRLKGVDPRMRVEMSSTGEVACFGKTYEEALLTAMLASEFKMPTQGVFLALECERDILSFMPAAAALQKSGLPLYGFPLVAAQLRAKGIACSSIDISTMLLCEQADLIQFLKSGQIDFVISIPGSMHAQTTTEGFYLRRLAVDLEISLITDLNLAKEIVHALSKVSISTINILSWKEYQLL